MYDTLAKWTTKGFTLQKTLSTDFITTECQPFHF